MLNTALHPLALICITDTHQTVGIFILPQKVGLSNVSEEHHSAAKDESLKARDQLPPVFP